MMNFLAYFVLIPFAVSASESESSSQVWATPPSEDCIAWEIQSDYTSCWMRTGDPKPERTYVPVVSINVTETVLSDASSTWTETTSIFQVTSDYAMRGGDVLGGGFIKPGWWSGSLEEAFSLANTTLSWYHPESDSDNGADSKSVGLSVLMLGLLALV